MNIQKRPFAVDFVGNNPEFVVRANPYYTEGRRYSRSFAFVSMLAGEIRVQTPHGNKTYPVRLSSSGNAPTMIQADDIEDVLANLNGFVKYDRFLTTYYDIEITRETDRVVLKLTDKEYKDFGSDVTIGSTGFVGDVSVVSGSTVSGLDRVPKDKYRVMCQFEVSQNGTTKLTPEFFFDVNNGLVRIGTSMLKSFFEKLDVPRYQEEVGVYPCVNAMMDVKLLYSESIGSGLQLLIPSAYLPFQSISIQESSRPVKPTRNNHVFQTPVVSLVNGKIEQYARDNNIADWKPVYNDKFYQHSKVDVFGMDNDGQVVADWETEQYLYICNFTGTAKSGRVKFEVLQGTTTHEINAGVFPIPTGVSRIPSSIFTNGVSGMITFRLEPSEVVQYRIVLSITGQNDIVRRYVMVPRPYNARTMMLLNRVNLYETFVVDNVAEECVTEGERATTGNSDGYVINDCATQYTARTGFRTAKQIAVLRDAFSKEDNLILDGHYACRVSILPGSFKVLDEAEDLLNVEFQFLLGERQDRLPAVVTGVSSNTGIDYTDTLINSL